MSDRYRAPVVRRAFAILEALSGRERRKRAAWPRASVGVRGAVRRVAPNSPPAWAMSLSALSRAAGIGKSTTLGILDALEDAGAVVRDPATKKYALGLALLELGRAVDSRIDLKDVARPVMEDLAAKTSESVFLGVRFGDHVTILDVVESARDLKITAPVGTRIPLLAGATGKVFVASMPEDRAAELVRSRGLRRYTDRSITDPEAYLAAVRAARSDGYALDDEEYIPGVRAAASPIPDGGWRAAAVWVVGFTPSMDDEKLAAIANETRRAAEAISRKIASQG